MQHKYDINAVDQCLRNLLEVSNHLHLIALELTYYLEYPFGGITVVFGGDFHHNLPVVPKGTHQQEVVVSLCRGNLWEHVKFLHLRQNMCLGPSETDNQHAQWLLEIGTGSTMDNNEMIQVSQSIVCTNLNALINRIYVGIGNPRAQDNQYFLDCIILCPRNDQVYDINETILQQFNPNAEVHMLRSVDSVSEENRMHYAYPIEFLQQLNASGLPPALLCLKVGSPVILLRNLDPEEGLCNGTRIIVLNVRKKVLQCRIISKDRRFRGKVVLIPRIRLSPNAKTLSVPLKRLQFPVRLAFAMTINKSQGQSVEHVGINLQTSVFSHGQLYVVFSRCTSPLNISVLLLEQSQESRRTFDVVYKEVFNSIRLSIVFVSNNGLEIDF